MKQYTVIIEKGEHSYGAWVPDLPGCVAVAGTMAEVEKLIKDAIEFHLQGLREEGLEVPEPASRVIQVAVGA